MEGARGSSEERLIENINVREEARQSAVARRRGRRSGNTNERSLSSLCFTALGQAELRRGRRDEGGEKGDEEGSACETALDRLAANTRDRNAQIVWCFSSKCQNCGPFSVHVRLS